MLLTFFRLVISVLAVRAGVVAVVTVVVQNIAIVVVLSAGPHHPHPHPLLLLQLGVLVAEEPRLLAQRERITGDELARAGRAAETLQVEDPILGAHDVVALAEGAAALVALGPEEAGVVLLAVGPPVTHEARAVLVQEHLTLGTL